MWWHHWMNPAEKQERSDGQTLEFNNNKTDCWNILINNTNNSTISSFSDRAVIVTNRTLLSVPAHLLPPYDGDGRMHFGHFVAKVDASCLKSPPASRYDVWNINERVKFNLFLSVLEKTLVSVRDDEATTKSSLYRETTRHNTNNNFIFTLRPKHRTEPAINRVEDDAEPAVGDDGEYSGRRCQKEPESLQEDVRVGWWFIHTTTTVPLFWKCDQINPDV